MTPEEKRAKHAAYMREWYKRHPGYKRAQYVKNIDENRRKGRDRYAKYYATPEGKAAITASNKAWRDRNKDKMDAYLKEWREENMTPARAKVYTQRFQIDSRAKYLLGRAKTRAKQKGVPFSITLADIVIPEVCPVLGIPLNVAFKVRNHPNAPSLDRVVPALGYVPGNINVISYRANTLKNNASADELKRIIDYIRRETAKPVPVMDFVEFRKKFRRLDRSA